MSIVLVGAKENYLIMMSDGRVTRGNSEIEIIDENFKKLKRLSNNVCIGFAGSKEPCEEVLDYIVKYHNNESNYNILFYIIYHQANNVLAKYIKNGIYIKMKFVLGGLFNNEIKFKTLESIDYKLNTISIKSYFDIGEHIPKGDALSYAMMSPNEVNGSLFYNMLCENTKFDIEDIKNTMIACVEIASQNSKTINTNTFVEIINKE